MKTFHSLEAIEAHLQSNVHPVLGQQAITGILGTLKKLNEGKLSPSDLIAPGSDCTVLELCQDLHIDLVQDNMTVLGEDFPRRTSNELKNIKLTNNESLLRFQWDGIDCIMYWNGGENISYTFSVDGVELDRGNDFRPSPMKPIEDIESIISLLGFMCVRPGDTDKDYFKDHTTQHLEWLNSSQCEGQLLPRLYDIEAGPESDEPEMYVESLAFFKEHTEIYPEL